jgi:Na+/H+ antiporter NhaD/arsenite permease-like protein
MDSLDYWRQMGWGMAALDCAPFLLFLFLIAVLPFISVISSWWERPTSKFFTAVFFAGAGIAIYLFPDGDPAKVFGIYLDYLAFVVLLGALFTVSGGIHISGAFAGFPWVNTLFLAIGALLSNVLGTTGASLLLIRPLLHANQHRKHKAHIVVFFIYVVSNCAACLIPLGPPLYLGYLRGVPFFWTLRLAAPCALTVGLLLVLFHFYDERVFEKEELESKGRMAGDVAKARRKIHIQGWGNLGYLVVMIGTILFTGYVLNPAFSHAVGGQKADLYSKAFQTLVMAMVAVFSYRTTPEALHRQNRFHFGPMWEVAILFFGIFGCMIPVLALLEAKGDVMAISHPWQFFWVSGILSAFLDNAPTYLSATALAASQRGLEPSHLGDLAEKFPALLAAISCGSSFMGALTYIGNGPNFMVRAIAEQARVKMPSFGGYMLWSGAVLIPVFILITFIFF